MQRSSLYDEDILLWSEQQAEALRQLRHARDLPSELDLENVVEEIESVGREQLYAVESGLRLMLVHLIKLALEPHSEAARHWRGEILNWHSDLGNRFAPSMAQRLSMDKIWRQAVRQASEAAASPKPPRTSQPSPLSLEALLAEELAIDELIARLVEALRSRPPS